MFCIFNHCLKLWNFYQKRKKSFETKTNKKRGRMLKTPLLIPRTYISRYYNVIAEPTMTMLLKLKTMRFVILGAYNKFQK